MKPSAVRAGIAMVGMAGGLALAGCGSAPPLVHSLAAHAPKPVSLAADDTADVCAPEHQTMKIAIEAYVAMTGVLPGTEADLVTGGFLRRESDNFDLAIADGNYQIVAVSDRCAGFQPGTPTVSTDPPLSSPAPSCDAQRKVFETAWEAYRADHGNPPASEADLVPDYMRAESTGFDLVGTEIVAVPGVCD
jgi:hypothetical protein